MPESDIQQKIQQAMAVQLQHWREELTCDNRRLGWKVGFNRQVDQAKFELPSAMIGYLTTGRQIPNGGICHTSPQTNLLAEPEIALRIGADITRDTTPKQAQAAVNAVAPAIEIVDTSRTDSKQISEILATNLYHHAVIIGEPLTLCSVPSAQDIRAALYIDDEQQRSLEPDRVPDEFGTLITTVAGILADQGECLRTGDWIITGAASTAVEIKAGNKILLQMRPFGKVNFSVK
ncbi:MAG: fumarylacetoacetate hydrolase family protein [Gammaproteobacteria bacterium]|nr:fumarylacetoacetate hydrolase family protein [Gammaproteobacteria bacterium]